MRGSLRRHPKVQFYPRVPDGNAGFVYVRDTLFAFALDDADEQTAHALLVPSGLARRGKVARWVAEQPCCPTGPRRVGRQFGVIGDGQVRYRQSED